MGKFQVPNETQESKCIPHFLFYTSRGTTDFNPQFGLKIGRLENDTIRIREFYHGPYTSTPRVISYVNKTPTSTGFYYDEVTNTNKLRLWTAYSDNTDAILSSRAYGFTVNALTLHVNLQSELFEKPIQTELAQNYPNPFNPTTSIVFSISETNPVSIVLFDALGRKVATLADGHFQTGTHTLQFNASSLSSGMYFYQMKTGNFMQTKKMLLLK
jgi:hypothetical protein